MGKLPVKKIIIIIVQEATVNQVYPSVPHQKHYKWIITLVLMIH